VLRATCRASSGGERINHTRRCCLSCDRRVSSHFQTPVTPPGIQGIFLFFNSAKTAEYSSIKRRISKSVLPQPPSPPSLSLLVVQRELADALPGTYFVNVKPGFEGILLWMVYMQAEHLWVFQLTERKKKQKFSREFYRKKKPAYRGHQSDVVKCLRWRAELYSDRTTLCLSIFYLLLFLYLRGETVGDKRRAKGEFIVRIKYASCCFCGQHLWERKMWNRQKHRPTAARPDELVPRSGFCSHDDTNGAKIIRVNVTRADRSTNNSNLFASFGSRITSMAGEQHI